MLAIFYSQISRAISGSPLPSHCSYEGLQILAWTADRWPDGLKRIASASGVGIERLRQVGAYGRYTPRTLQTVRDAFARWWPSRAPFVRQYKALGKSTPKPSSDARQKHHSGGVDYASYFRELRKFVFRQRLDWQNANDLTQRVLLKLFEADHGHIADRRAYAYRIAVREVTAYKQRRLRHEVCQRAIEILYGDHVETRDPLRHLAGRESLVQLMHAVDRLPSRARSAWLSARLGNRPRSQVASQAGVGLSAVHKLVRRADRRVRAELPGGGTDPRRGRTLICRIPVI